MAFCIGLETAPIGFGENENYPINKLIFILAFPGDLALQIGLIWYNRNYAGCRVKNVRGAIKCATTNVFIVYYVSNGLSQRFAVSMSMPVRSA